jgi:hypothetical protein
LSSWALRRTRPSSRLSSGQTTSLYLTSSPRIDPCRLPFSGAGVRMIKHSNIGLFKKLLHGVTYLGQSRTQQPCKKVHLVRRSTLPAIFEPKKKYKVCNLSTLYFSRIYSIYDSFTLSSPSHPRTAQTKHCCLPHPADPGRSRYPYLSGATHGDGEDARSRARGI